MDELEFRKRVYANPAAPDQDTLDAARDNPDYERILNQVRMLDSEVSDLVRSVPVPEELRSRLTAIPDTEAAADAAAVAATGHGDRAAPSQWRFYALAASLVLAVAVTFGYTANRENQLSPQEVAFGNDVLRHLLMENAEITAIREGTLQSVVGMPTVRQVVSSTGAQLVNDFASDTMPVRIAKQCIVIPAYRSAHLMLQGSEGAVNVIIINNNPVSVEYTISDDRFSGKVIPMGQGNVVVIGEKNEDLEIVETLFAEHMDWAI